MTVQMDERIPHPRENPPRMALSFLTKWLSRPSTGLPTVEPVAIEHWLTSGGLRHPDWNLLQPSSPEERLGMVVTWLQELQAQLGPEFRVDRTRHFWVLSPFSERKAKFQTQFLEMAWEKLTAWFGGADIVDETQPRILLVLKNPDQYWRYVSRWARASVQGASAGMTIRQGQVHTVTFDADGSALQAVIAHELVHDLLSGLDLPVWVEEGLSQLFPDSLGLSGSRLHRIKDEVPHLQSVARRYGLKDFWSGRGFGMPDDRQELAYSLAEVLTRLLLERANPGGFAAFLREASAEDAGESACREHLKCGLAELAATFLGPGDWEPQPSAAASVWRHLKAEEWEQAIELADRHLSEDAEAETLRLGKALALLRTPRWREADFASLPDELKGSSVLLDELRLNFGLGDESGCARVVQQLLKISTSLAAQAQGQVLYAFGHYDQASQAYSALRRAHPKQAESFAVWEGWAQLKLGRFEKANELLQSLSSPEADSVPLLLGAELALQAGDLERAQKQLTLSRAVAPDDISTWQLLGELAEKQGRSADACAAYQSCLELADRAGPNWPPEQERVERARSRLDHLGPPQGE